MRILNGILRGNIINNHYNKGLYITIFNLMRFGILIISKDKSAGIDISLSVYKLGTHLHFTMNEDNICRDETNRKSK